MRLERSGERFIEVVAEIPAMREVELRLLHELTFRADALEEYHQLEPEKTTGSIEGRPPVAERSTTHSRIDERSRVASRWRYT
jgi:hypothetical protein